GFHVTGVQTCALPIFSDALTSAIVVPKPMVEDLHAWREETRTLEHVQIDPKKVTVAEPDEAKLKETFEAQKADFMTPEYRKVAEIGRASCRARGHRWP